MLSNFQTPTDFEPKILIDDIEVIYNNLKEISQGGPVVGSISINGKSIQNKLFGGPSLIKDRLLLVPIFIKRFIGWRFKLAIINVDTLDLNIIGEDKRLIFLDRIENRKVYYFENIDKTLANDYTLI